MFKVTAQFIAFAALLFQFNVATAATTQWDHLKDDSFEAQVKFTNNSYRDLIGATEFVNRVDLIPYGFDNKPIETMFDLTYRTFMPRRLEIGKMTFFSQQIPLRYLFDSHLDLKQVAYFQVHFKIIEDDFFMSQKVVHFAVKLTPFGISGLNKISKQPSYSNKVTISMAPEQEVSAQGVFSLGLTQSALAKVKKEGALLEARIKHLLDESKNLK